MGRPPGGYEILDVARELLTKTSCAREIRILQAVILPLENRMSIRETAKVIGRNADWVSRERNAFIRRGGLPEKISRKRLTRNRALMTLEQEQEFLAQFTEVAGPGQALVVSDIREALQKQLGKKVALATVYNILHRNDWHKMVSDRRNAIVAEDHQDGGKKTPQPESVYRTGVGQTHSVATVFSG